MVCQVLAADVCLSFVEPRECWCLLETKDMDDTLQTLQRCYSSQLLMHPIKLLNCRLMSMKQYHSKAGMKFSWALADNNGHVNSVAC